VGPCVSDGRGREEVLLRARGKMGHGLVWSLGRNSAPGPLSYFPFSFLFSFLFSFDFCLKLANTSDLNLSHTLKFIKLSF
jgi:hypothetical protein